MAKIQCPHCKAMNQDVSMDDPCWQCGTVLSAPVSALETGEGPPTSEANPANVTGSSSAPIQAEIEKRTPGASKPASERPRPSSSNQMTIAVAAVLIAIILIAIFFFLKVHH